MPRIEIMKTHKLFINGKFVRSESGRSLKVENMKGKVIAHLCRASRKDLRDAVEAARKAQGSWAGRDAYNRGQILYRMAEMMEGKRSEFVDALAATVEGGKRRAGREVAAAIDRVVHYAGWADKFSQVLGCHNPVVGPYYNFTVPEPTGIVACVAPDEEPLLALITLIAPPLCAGNVVIALGSSHHPLATAIFAEVAATSDVPGGVINLLTGYRAELIEGIADHREINAIHAANLPKKEAKVLREGSSENVKRVHILTFSAPEKWYDTNRGGGESPWVIEPFVEMKTIWHPAGI